MGKNCAITLDATTSYYKRHIDRAMNDSSCLPNDFCGTDNMKPLYGSPVNK